MYVYPEISMFHSNQSCIFSPLKLKKNKSCSSTSIQFCLFFSSDSKTTSPQTMMYSQSYRKKLHWSEYFFAPFWSLVHMYSSTKQNIYSSPTVTLQWAPDVWWCSHAHCWEASLGRTGHRLVKSHQNKPLFQVTNAEHGYNTFGCSRYGTTMCLTYNKEKFCTARVPSGGPIVCSKAPCSGQTLGCQLNM